MTRHALEVLAFDDLVLGDEWESPARTVTETDVVLFAGLSGDFNPLHCNHELSKKGLSDDRWPMDLLGLAIATGLISHAPRIDTLAFLAILEWKFLLRRSASETPSGWFPGSKPASPGERPPRHRHLASSRLEPGFNHAFKKAALRRSFGAGRASGRPRPTPLKLATRELDATIQSSRRAIPLYFIHLFSSNNQRLSLG